MLCSNIPKFIHSSKSGTKSNGISPLWLGMVESPPFARSANAVNALFALQAKANGVAPITKSR